MWLTIGELARRLRVTTRTLRHYETLGLLRPAHVDPRTGYRTYGHAELLTGLRIEQLKATGMALATIAAVLRDASALDATLAARRDELHAAIGTAHRQLATVEALARALADTTVALGEPRLVEAPAVEALVAEAMTTPEELAATVRRTVQRLRRRVGRVRCRVPVVCSARFPLDLDDEIGVSVAAHVEAPVDGSVTIAGAPAVEVAVVGPYSMLPVAYHAALSAVQVGGLTPLGWVWEVYRGAGTVPDTRVLIPVEREGRGERAD